MLRMGEGVQARETARNIGDRPPLTLKTSTGRIDLGSQGSKLPDIVTMLRDGRVESIEVRSYSQTIPSQISKREEMRAALPASARGNIVVYNQDLEVEFISEAP